MTKGASWTSQTAKMELFAKMANGWKLWKLLKQLWTPTPFMHNVEKWSNNLNKLRWTRQDFKVCLAIFQHYEWKCQRRHNVTWGITKRTFICIWWSCREIWKKYIYFFFQKKYFSRVLKTIVFGQVSPWQLSALLHSK